MMNIENTLIPIQPYFVLGSTNFYQKIYLKNGISHFYTYETTKTGSTILAVPDGCIDILFEYDEDSVSVYACGTVLRSQDTTIGGGKKYFGVRLMPGVCLDILGIPMKDLVEQQIPLNDRPIFRQVAEEIMHQKFEDQIVTFIRAYDTKLMPHNKESAAHNLVFAVMDAAYESGGMIRVHDLEELTGYTSRYIHKVFREEMGYSAKSFCRIIKFQRTILHLIYNGEVKPKLTDVAAEFGYCDQAQFIKDFKQYAGMTPREYMKLMVEQGYTLQTIGSSDFHNFLKNK